MRYLQVIILCVIYQIPNTNPTIDEKISDNQLTEIPGLDILKDVIIWKDNQYTSISKIFGPNLQDWSDNFQFITDIAFTALCCLYSSQTANFIETAEKDLTKCDDMPDIRMLIECLNAIKVQLKSMRVSTVKMLTTLLNYSNKFYTPLNKNVLNAIMSFYLYVNSITNETSENTTENEANEHIKMFTKKFFKMKLYTRNMFEAFAVLNCSWETFYGSQSNLINVYDDTFIDNLNLPETKYKQDCFNTNTLFLTNVTDIRFDKDPQTRSLGYLVVELKNKSIWLNGYYKRYAEDYRSEIITKSQTMVFESIAMIIFFLIREIIHTSINSGQAYDSHTQTSVNDAIILLDDFNFPGSLSVNLRKVVYQKMISSNNSEALKSIFDVSLIDSFEIEEIVVNSSNVKTKTVNVLTSLLEQFTNDLKSMESDIKTVRDINENLCDYECKEVGFLQYDFTKYNFKRTIVLGPEELKQAFPILKWLKNNNCQFSFVVVVHFILNDFIISQCESLTMDANNVYMSNQLESCFNYLKKSIVSIGDTLDHSLNTIIETLNLTRPYNNANRKVIDSILAMKLYFSNDNLLNSRVPLTEQGTVDKNGVLAKLDAMKRSHRYFINLIEQYMVRRCSTPPSREEFMNTTINVVNEYCRSYMDEKDKADIIKCVNKIIDENLKKYEPDVSPFNKYDYSVGNLLMNDILKKAFTRDGSLSLLDEINFSWDGNFKSLTEIVDIVKNNINPKYLYKYQLTIIKAIFFIAYEKMKTIIQTSTTEKNFLLYSNNMHAMLDALNFICSEYFPLSITRIYKMILAYFEEYFQNNTSINKSTFIRIIDVEQYYLGIQKETINASVDETGFLLPNLILEMTSELPDVEMTSESSDVEMSESFGLEIDVDKSDGQENIKQLLLFIVDIKEIWLSLKNVALVLDLRQMKDV